MNLYYNRLINVMDHSWTSDNIFRASYILIPEIFMKLLTNGPLLQNGLSWVGYVLKAAIGCIYMPILAFKKGYTAKSEPCIL